MPRRVSEAKMKRYLRRALDELGVFGVRIDVFLVSDEVMRDLNRRFRGKDSPTNVLSIESSPEVPHPDTPLTHLGEIYLAPEYIATHNENIYQLLLHGALHLIGYDHERRAERAVMERVESALWHTAQFWD